MAEQREWARESLLEREPKTCEALKRIGLTLNEFRGQAGVGNETVRKALHGKGVGLQSARAIASVLGEGLEESEIEALKEELRLLPQKNF